MSEREHRLIAIVALCIGAVTLIAAMQEKDPSYPPTRQWTLSIIDGHDYSKHRVVAIETAGVCLYVLTNDATFDSAITAVPKTQLPKGAGCQ